jgi:hypothetical protein
MSTANNYPQGWEGLFADPSITANDNDVDPAQNPHAAKVFYIAQSLLDYIRNDAHMNWHPDLEMIQRSYYKTLRYETEKEKTVQLRSAMDTCLEDVAELNRMMWEVTRKRQALWASRLYVKGHILKTSAEERLRS